MTKKGKFIVIEGVGGSGKTTQVDYAYSLLRKNRLKVIKTREPGGILAAEEIRKLIFNLRNEKLIGAEGQMVLFFAARKLWIDNLVEPSLEKGINVLTDRCHTSTNAYQGYAEGGDRKKIFKISNIVMGKCKPNAVILLNVSPKTALRRKQDNEGDPFDKEGIKYLQKLSYGYRKMAKEGWGGLKWYVVDGEFDQEAVNKDVKRVLEKIFHRRLKD
jgi:dTMP kinase